jgi:chitinase domain-containing protein 1
LGRGLLGDAASSVTIVAESSFVWQNTSKHFEGDVLGYVTPWNSHGYDVAKGVPGKFSIVSPVWLQLKGAEGGKVRARHLTLFRR